MPCVLPTRCHAEQADPTVCRIGVHHRRERKTGPRFPVVVLICYAHQRGFTLYPLGHVPYGRVALAPVTTDGEVVVTVTDESGPARPDWGSTIFGAVQDAAAGRAWAREDAIGKPLWQTQLRYLAEGARLLGLAASLAPSVGEAVATRLEVPRLLHLEAVRAYELAAGYQERGRAICSVLDRLHPGPCLVDRLLACGAQVGMWDRVVRWDATASGAGCRVFPPPARAAPW